MKLTHELLSEFGQELTWIYKTHKPYKNITEEEIIDSYKNLIIIELFNKNIKFFDIIRDASCLEISTIPFKDINNYIKYYTKIKNIVEKFPLTPKHKYKFGGGGHIHINLNKIKIKYFNDDYKLFNKFIINLFKDMVNRPYLNWMFNEYCDDVTAEPLLMSKINNSWDIIEYLNNYSVLENSLDPIDDISSNIYKSYCLRIDVNDRYFNYIKKPTTIEFRFFDSPLNLKESLEHINFVNSYLHYIIDLTKKEKNIEITINKIKDIKNLIKKDKAINEFKSLINTLGLDWNVYKRYIKMNYEWRKFNNTWFNKSNRL